MGSIYLEKIIKSKQYIPILKLSLAFLFFLLGFKLNYLFLIAYLIISYDTILKAFKDTLNGKFFNECFLMTVATFGAIYLNELAQAVAIMFLYQLGEFIEEKAVEKSKNSIKNLVNLRPEFVNIIKENKIEKISPEDTKIGDTIIVKTGEKIPLDGIILNGNSFVDTSFITGETKPKRVSKNSEVFSGSINLEETITIKVTKLYKNSTVSKILDAIQNATSKKTKTERFITKFAKIYTPTVICLACLYALITVFYDGGNYLSRAISFLVISCPCALLLSIPLSFFMGIGKCSKNGILIKNSGSIEKLTKIQNAVFDKTGTLTNGNFEIVKINSNEKRILEYASAIENMSRHPIAKAIKKAYGKEVTLVPIKEFAGLGVSGIYENKEIKVGSAKFIGTEPIDEINNVVYVSVDGKYIGNIVIADTIKENSKKLINELNNKKIKTALLTGDLYKYAKNIANQLSLNAFYSELLPEDKLAKLEDIINDTKKGSTIYIGDGINDAPALKRADVGIAMDSLSVDAAFEFADIVIMDNNPIKILYLINTSKQVMKVIKINVTFIISIKLLFIALCALGLISMWGAVFADVGVTFLAILLVLLILR